MTRQIEIIQSWRFSCLLLSIAMVVAFADVASSQSSHTVRRVSLPHRTTGSNPYDAISRRSYEAATMAHSNPHRAHPPRRRSAPYRLDEGDLLAIIVEGILGRFDSAPVHMPSRHGGDIAPSMGYPVPVRADGTINLPLVEPISVRGMTAREAQNRISHVYRDEKLLKRKHQVMVSVMRKRTVNVTVVYDEPPHPAALTSPYYAYQAPRKRIASVTLPADRADRLTALGQTGATFDADAEIITLNHAGRRVHGAAAKLPDGAVVESRSAPVDFFYTGGFLPPNRIPIPKQGLTLAQAVALSGGSIGQFPFGASDLFVVRNARAAGTASVRRVDLRGSVGAATGRVMPGDVLVLRQKPAELFGRVLLNAARGAVLVRP